MGYFLEFGIAVVLLTLVLIFEGSGRKRLALACRSISRTYADSAIALALSVELAASIMLIKRNYGLGSNDFGAWTVQITWTVALLVMLPVSTFCWQDTTDKRYEVRLCAIAFGFVLFLVTFICKMINTYSAGQIGSGSNAVLSDDEMEQIEQLCLAQGRQLSGAASTVIEIFSIGGSLWLAGSVLGALLRASIKGSDHHLVRRLKSRLSFVGGDRVILLLNLCALVVWSVPLYWALTTLRNIQGNFAEALGLENSNNEWSFGQILAVVVFVPVVIELWHQYLECEKEPHHVHQVQRVAQCTK